MRIQMRVAYLDCIPLGYGIAWADMNRREAVCYPIGLHLVMRWLRDTWLLVAAPSEWEWVKRRDWEDRLEDMRETELKCTVRTVKYAASLNGGMVVVRCPELMTAADRVSLLDAIYDMLNSMASDSPSKVPHVVVVPSGTEFETISAQRLKQMGLIHIDEASRIVERVVGGRKGARYGIRSTDSAVGAADYGAAEAARSQN